MRKWKKIAAVLLCLLFVQAPVLSLTEPVPVEAAVVKSGLKKENGKYYFYVKGQRVKNTWKSVKTASNGKTTVSRYYFGKNGAAYAGKRLNGMYVPAVKKINGKYYGFGIAARMLKGIYVVNDRLCVFNAKTGVYDSARSNQLRKASAYERDAAQLRKLLGKPNRTQVLDSCYGDGKDLMLYYPNFIVSLFKNTKGKEIVLGVLSK